MPKPENASLKAYLPLLFAVVLIIGVLLGSRLGVVDQHQWKNKPGVNHLPDIINYVTENYVDTVNRDKLLSSSIEGMLESLDPHSQYIPPQEYNNAIDPLMGNFEGIGVQFQIIKDTVTVIQTIQGGPSEKAGVRAGDRIVSIEKEVIAGKKIKDQDVIRKLKGQKGTQVKIGVFRRGNKNLLPFTLTRDVIPTYSIDAKYLIDKQTAFIKVSRFSVTTDKEFSEALKGLILQGAKKLILDLRGNTGGFLDAASRIADEFLPEGDIIVYTEGRKRARKNYNASRGGQFEKGDLIILIDEGSASASEILAGAIQDNDRGTLIGRRSFGKGLVQEQLDLPGHSAIRLTVARYYTPTGRCIQKPYSKGTSEYDKEFTQRMLEGEFEHPDSLRFPDSLKYKTPKGKIVYGGGGIMPDIYITLNPKDPTTLYYHKIMNSGLVNQLAFDYVDANRSALARYKDAKTFQTNYRVPDTLLKQLAVQAVKNGIPRLNTVQARVDEELRILIKALIARNLYDDNGFYPIYNQNDKTVAKALEVLRK